MTQPLSFTARYPLMATWGPPARNTRSRTLSRRNQEQENQRRILRERLNSSGEIIYHYDLLDEEQRPIHPPIIPFVVEPDSEEARTFSIIEEEKTPEIISEEEIYSE
jgi:hypothetical protein